LAKDSDSLVCETLETLEGYLSTAEHVEFCGNPPGPSGKAKYQKGPIVNKYREGKVKNTPVRGVK
jgi:hypothetical protein